ASYIGHEYVRNGLAHAAGGVAVRCSAIKRPLPPLREGGGGSVLAALVVLLAFATALPSLAFAQSQQTAAPQHTVHVERVVSPGGIEAWLVSNSTVPMIVMVASWRGGSAMEPQALTGVTSTTADMLTEGAGDMDSQAFKGRMEDLNMSLGFSA